MERGWLDEGRFAESFVRSRVERAYGPLRIAADLTARDLPRETIARALEPFDDQWSAIGERALRRRFGGRGPATPADHRRYRGYLLRRGFPAELVSRLLRQ